jgi:pyruvate carboxylase subunit B
VGKYEVTLDGRQHAVEILHGTEITVDGQQIQIVSATAHAFTVRVGERFVRVTAAQTDGALQVLVNGCVSEAMVLSDRDLLLRRYAQGTATLAASREVRAPMPALVVRIEVAPGDTVKKGQGLVVLEAMKMENELRATRDCVVREVCVVPGNTVERNALLLRLE